MIIFLFSVIVKGSSVSKYYRFIGKNSDWVWMQTRATIIYNTSNVPQYIVCMNYIIRYDLWSAELISVNHNSYFVCLVIIYMFSKGLNVHTGTFSAISGYLDVVYWCWIISLDNAVRFPVAWMLVYWQLTIPAYLPYNLWKICTPT